MDRSRVIDTLRAHKTALQKQGVAHAALFGSLARGEARADSDIDILIALDPDLPLSIYDYVGIKDYIAGLFDEPVDVVVGEGIKPHLREAVRNHSIDAF